MQEARQALWRARGDVAPIEYRRDPPEDLDDREFRIMDQAMKQFYFPTLRLLDEAVANITAYAAPRCFVLCQKMQEKLLKELRDLIYSFPLSGAPAAT